MSIYSRSGDNGKTDLFPWGRISKTDQRIEVLGNLDELNSWLGILRAQPLDRTLDTQLETFQNVIFRISAELSCPLPAQMGSLERLQETEIAQLETLIDDLESKLPPLRHFVTFQGPEPAAFSQLARAVCRRAERSAWRLAPTGMPETSTAEAPVRVSPEILRWLNRFSDFLFTLGRAFSEKIIEVPPND